MTHTHARDDRAALHAPLRSPRLLGLCALTAAGAIALGACSSSGATTAPSSVGASAGGAVLAARQLSGVGTVLVDQSGKTVYTPDQEASGMIRCTGSCLSFWTPVTVPSGSTALPSGLGGALSTIHRPDDGTDQVTFNGKPLYTFKLDRAPGQTQGNDFDDQFNGTTFTWRAVNAAGTQASPGPSSPAPAPAGTGNGYGSGSGY